MGFNGLAQELQILLPGAVNIQIKPPGMKIICPPLSL
jgi:hypothetical protein